jgi:hypothetical protein
MPRGEPLTAQQVLPGASVDNRTGGRRCVAILERVEAVGADADPAWFPTDGIVHLDLHTDNLLAGDDGTLTGIIDWDGACAGDPGSTSTGRRLGAPNRGPGLRFNTSSP